MWRLFSRPDWVDDIQRSLGAINRKVNQIMTIQAGFDTKVSAISSTLAVVAGGVNATLQNTANLEAEIARLKALDIDTPGPDAILATRRRSRPWSFPRLIPLRSPSGHRDPRRAAGTGRCSRGASSRPGRVGSGGDRSRRDSHHWRADRLTPARLPNTKRPTLRHVRRVGRFFAFGPRMLPQLAQAVTIPRCPLRTPPAPWCTRHRRSVAARVRLGRTRSGQGSFRQLWMPARCSPCRCCRQRR